MIRFKVPLQGATRYEDLLLGPIERANRDINPDPVLLKSDGFPTYHLAAIVDDHEMRISHVLRAQEWVSSAPLHVLIFEACGWQPPRYAHLPAVNGPDGRKLGKRHGATGIGEFRRRGFLPQALVNYLALLGWSPGDDRELFRLDELERAFSLERLGRAGAVFDHRKLEWFNGQYIRMLSPPNGSRRRWRPTCRRRESKWRTTTGSWPSPRCCASAWRCSTRCPSGPRSWPPTGS